MREDDHLPRLQPLFEDEQEQEKDRQQHAGQPEQDSPLPSPGLAGNADGSASDGQGQPDPGNTDVTDRGDCLSQDPVEKPSAPVLAAVLDAAELLMCPNNCNGNRKTAWGQALLSIAIKVWY